MTAAKFTRKLFISLLIISVLSNSLFAQKTASTKKAAAPKCSGAWTGTVTYTRTQSANNDKTVERVSGRGKDTTHFEMSYNYTAQAVIAESPAMDGTSIAKATVNHTMTSKETVHGVESNSCDRGKSWKEMSGTSTSTSSTTGDGRVEANFNVGMNSDGTYSVSIGVPEIQGKVTGSQSSTFSGQCTAKEGKSSSLPATPISLDGHSLTSDGTTRVDPGNPDHISGSYSLKTPGDVTETITWSLKRCGGALQINDLKFEDMKFPTWNDWKEITEQVGTIDGNWVKVKAKVINTSGQTKFAEVYFKETYKGDKWDGAKPDMPLKDETFSIRLEPGEERDVEMLWDTSGYAWFDDGRPRLVQRIKAEVWENYKLQDEMTKNLKVAPKPLVLVHGLWEDYRVWGIYQNMLTTTHSYDWKAFPVNENASKGYIAMGDQFGKTLSIYDNADQLARYVKYVQEEANAWHVDMVAHSMGGLVARLYAQKQPTVPDGRPQVKHLVMLGTPNAGAACVDVFAGKFGLFKKELNAAKELTGENMTEFNRHVVNTGGTKFSALAGNPVPIICGGMEWNDGLITVKSAKYGVSDTGETNSLTNQMFDIRTFNNFVKPHLITGPKGTYPSEVVNDPTDWRRWQLRTSINNPGSGSGRYQDASREDLYRMVSYARESAAPIGEVSQPFSGEVKLGPKQITDIEVPVEAAQNFGLTFMANPSVTVSLIDDKGRVLRKEVAGSEFASAMFRMLFADKPLIKNTWKLRLENTSDLEQEFAGYGWSLAVTPGPERGAPVAE
jgi:pimeloyl-ACP methyl ester carboxylesterase